MIETSNGLRCIRSHWQYYSRSTAPARQRKTKANCRRNRSKMASYKCCGTGPNQTTFSQTDCCKLPKEISGNKAGNGRKKKKKNCNSGSFATRHWCTNPTYMASKRKLATWKQGRNNCCLSKACRQLPTRLRGKLCVRKTCLVVAFEMPAVSQWKCANLRLHNASVRRTIVLKKKVVR